MSGKIKSDEDILEDLRRHLMSLDSWWRTHVPPLEQWHKEVRDREWSEEINENKARVLIALFEERYQMQQYTARMIEIKR